VNFRGGDLTKKRKILALLLILSAGLLFRLAYLEQYSLSPIFDIPSGPDVTEYHEWAKEILSGRILWMELKLHSPGYPFFLAFLLHVMSMDLFPVRFLQQAIFLASGLALMYFLFMRGDDRVEIRKGLLAAFLWAFYPPLVYVSGELVSEALLLPLLCAVMIFHELAVSADGRRAGLFCALCGIASALAALTHPLSLIFVLANFAVLCWRLRAFAHPPAKFTGFAIFAFALTLAPVSIYNGVQFGKFFPLQANGGFNFYLGNNQAADGTCNVRPGPAWDKIHAEAKFATSGTGMDKDGFFLMKSLYFIAGHPLHWGALLARKAFLAWNMRELLSGADMPEFRYFTPIQRLTSWSFAVIGTLGLSGFVGLLFSRRPKRGELIMAALLLSFWLAQILTVSSSRYRTAMLPAVIFFSAAFIVEFKSVFLVRGRRVATLCIVLAALLAVCVFPAPSDARMLKAETDSIMGEALFRSGDIDGALDRLLSASRLDPGWSRNHNMLGMIYASKGMDDKAEKEFFVALNCPDSDRSALMNMAMLQDKKGDKASAERFWSEAMKGPRTPDLLYNRGVKLQGEGRDDEAMGCYVEALDMLPFHPGSLNNAGILLLKRGDARGAAKLFRRAYRLNGRNFDVGVNLAVALFESGDEAAAGELLPELEGMAKSESQKAKLGQLRKISGGP